MRRIIITCLLALVLSVGLYAAHSVGFAVSGPSGTQTAAARASEPQRQTVTLTGKVTLGGVVPPGMGVAALRPGAPDVVATVDKAGMFELRLPDVGDYVLAFRPLPHFTVLSRHVKVETGTNRVTVRVPNTSVRVALKWPDGHAAEPVVQLHVYAVDGPLIAERYAAILLSNGQTGPTNLRGLPPGRYLVAADTPSGFVTESAKTATLEIGRAVDVSIVMREVHGLLEVLDAHNAPLRGARATSAAMALKAVGAGRLELSRVSVGTPLIISAPGHTPQCRIVNANDLSSMRVQMQPGAETVTLILTNAAHGAAGSLLGLPGSQCAVPLAAFKPNSHVDGSSTTVRLEKLPRGTYTYLSLDGRRTPVTVPSARTQPVAAVDSDCVLSLPVRHETSQKPGVR